jgi:hypothetical protein
MTEFAHDAVSLLLTLGAAFTGSFLAVRQYRVEKRWDAKHSAYQEILTDVNAIHRWADENYAAHVPCLPSVSRDHLTELSRQFEMARDRLWQHVNTGELTICSDSVTLLRELMQEFEDERFNFEQEGVDDSNFTQEFSAHCEKIRSVIGNRLPSLIRSAKKDLKT